MDPKAQELIDFAKTNGFEIHSRTSPEEWVQSLAEHDGQCPCKHAPACPCEDAITRIKDPKRAPEDQVCGCTFFVSPAYLAHYKRQPWRPNAVEQPSLPGEKISTQSEYQKVREVNPIDEKKALDKVQIYLDSVDLIKQGQLKRLTEKMETEKRNSLACSLCADDAELIGTHSKYASTLCDQGRPGCNAELKKLIEEAVNVIDENFIAAGYERVSIKSEKSSTPDKPAKKVNAWIEFSQIIAKNPALEGKQQKYKMKIAAAVYREEYDTIEEAMEAISE